MLSENNSPTLAGLFAVMIDCPSLKSYLSYCHYALVVGIF